MGKSSIKLIIRVILFILGFFGSLTLWVLRMVPRVFKGVHFFQLLGEKLKNIFPIPAALFSLILIQILAGILALGSFVFNLLAQEGRLLKKGFKHAKL